MTFNYASLARHWYRSKASLKSQLMTRPLLHYKSSVVNNRLHNITYTFSIQNVVFNKEIILGFEVPRLFSKRTQTLVQSMTGLYAVASLCIQTN